MQKIIKFSLLVLLVSNVNATMMPKKLAEESENKVEYILPIGKVLRIYEYERKVSKKIGRKIVSIVKKELNIDNNVMGEIWEEQQERFFAQSDERMKEMEDCLLEVDLKKVRKASKRRQKECEGELLYWKDIRAQRLAREVNGRDMTRAEKRRLAIGKAAIGGVGVGVLKGVAGGLKVLLGGVTGALIGLEGLRGVIRTEKEKGKVINKQRQEESGAELILWKDIRAQRLAREVKNRGNSNSNHELTKKQIVKVEEEQKQEHVPKQERDLKLSRGEIRNILYSDDLVTFEKVFWKNISITKDEMLEQACFYGATKIALLLIKAGVDVKRKDEDGNTPLHWAVKNQDPQVAKLLIKGGADVNSRNNLGRTPLYDVLERGDVSLVKLFIEKGTDISSKDNYNKTVLEYGLWLNILRFSPYREKVINYIKSVIEKRRD